MEVETLVPSPPPPTKALSARMLPRSSGTSSSSCSSSVRQREPLRPRPLRGGGSSSSSSSRSKTAESCSSRRRGPSRTSRLRPRRSGPCSRCRAGLRRRLSRGTRERLLLLRRRRGEKEQQRKRRRRRPLSSRPRAPLAPQSAPPSRPPPGSSASATSCALRAPRPRPALRRRGTEQEGRRGLLLLRRQPFLPRSAPSPKEMAVAAASLAARASLTGSRRQQPLRRCPRAPRRLPRRI